MNLLMINDPELVSKTTLSRKLTIGGETKAYPVYRVRLDQLFYNDRNDRIATWITQYQNDVNNVAFSSLDREAYNGIIEKFIIDSNPGAIEKTKNNIALVNQREPGVVMTDGRIIDGNRRFTCLRLLHSEDSTVNYFETVILDTSGDNAEKQVKMLELAIQHGEEQRVDYNLIDLAIGAYHDIVETQLLSIDEYASSTNESAAEVRRRLDVASLIIEFLEHMGVPKQYHVAREMQVFSLFFELVPLLKRCETVESKNSLKVSVFNNAMMGTFADQRKYIRNVKALMDSGLYGAYIKKQEQIGKTISEAITEEKISNKADIDRFVKKNGDITEDLQISMDRAVLQSKKQQTKSRPTQIVNKSISLLMDIDTRVIDKLTDSEKDRLHTQLKKLNDTVSLIDDGFSADETPTSENTAKIVQKDQPMLGTTHIDEPFVYCMNEGKTLTSLSFSLTFSAWKYLPSQIDEVCYDVCFVNEKGELISPLQEFTVRENEQTKLSFSLNASASVEKTVFLLLKSSKDDQPFIQRKVGFPLNIAFQVDFDF